jgi:hypothetical protein
MELGEVDAVFKIGNTNELCPWSLARLMQYSK